MTKQKPLLDILKVNDSNYTVATFNDSLKFFDGDYIFHINGKHNLEKEFNFLANNLEDFKIDERFNSRLGYEKVPRFKMKEHKKILKNLADKRIKELIKKGHNPSKEIGENFYEEILNSFKYSISNQIISRLSENKLLSLESPPYKIEISKDKKFIYLIDSRIQNNCQRGVGNIYVYQIFGIENKGKNQNPLEIETLILSQPKQGKIKWLSNFETVEKARGRLYENEKLFDLDGYPAIMNFSNPNNEQKLL